MRFRTIFQARSFSRLFPIALAFLLIYTGCTPSGMLSGSENEGKALAAIHTEYGTMKAELYDATPKHRDNFLKLADKGYFDSTTFHRVIEGFMIQGGDPLTKKADPEKKIGEGGPGYTLEAEIRDSLFHKKGALAAARKGDRQNPERRSNGSQFYIVDGKKYPRNALKKLEARKQKKEEADFSFSEEQIDAYTSEGGAPHLDGAYTVFGEVIEGKNVIDSIAAVRVDPKKNRPVDPVRMEVEILERP
jgi:peptidyl-prolyl cis-trans isomerase B (cyclophilin B)